METRSDASIVPDDDSLTRGLFFIVGTGRCGTTLLQSMLTSHPNLVIPPETHFFAKFDPARRFSDPLRLEDVSAYLAFCRDDRYWRELGVDEAALEDRLRRGPRDARSIFLWILRHLAGSGGAGERIGEKTPRHARCVDRIVSLFPEARFIHIYRDPRDVVVSLRAMEWRFSDSVLLNARSCRKTYDSLLADAARLGPERYTSVRYETMVAEPEAELRRLCVFLDEPFDQAMLRYHEREHTGFLSTEAGWKDLTRKPIDLSRIGRYRDKLSVREIRTIERTIGPHLRLLGYEPAPGPADRPHWVVADYAEFGVWRLRRLMEGMRRRIARLVGRNEPASNGDA